MNANRLLTSSQLEPHTAYWMLDDKAGKEESVSVIETTSNSHTFFFPGNEVDKYVDDYRHCLFIRIPRPSLKAALKAWNEREDFKP